MSIAIPENVLCTHPNQYPKFETNVVPGTDWEISQYGPAEFYAFQFDQGDDISMPQLCHIKDEDGYDAVFASRDEALAAIQEVRAMDVEQPQ